MELIRIGHETFIRVLNMSVSACWIVLAVILLRIILKKAPKWISCALWGIVAIKLICPFSIESSLSLIPSGKPVKTDYLVTKPYADTGISKVDKVVNEYINLHYADDVTIASAKQSFGFVDFVSIVWIIGVIVLFIYALFSCLHLHKYVSDSVAFGNNIRISKSVKSPFILGIVNPVIYVPTEMSGSALDFVIKHEHAHIKRRDYLWKLIGYLLFSIHWFNPLIWISFALFCKDIELACDESVISTMDDRSRAEYIQTLLDCSASRSPQNACPVAFAEVGVKERIKAVINYKKPTFRIVVVAVLACIVVGVCFLTTPVTYGSLKTHAKQVGIGEPIGNKDLTYLDCNAFASAYTLLEHYYAVKEHSYSRCEIDGKFNYYKEVEFRNKEDAAAEDGITAEQVVLKNTEDSCTHFRHYYPLDQYTADILNVGIDVSQYPKKLEQTKENGYIKVVFDMGPCSIWNNENNELTDEWIKSHVHYAEGYTSLREYYIDPQSGLILKTINYDYQDGMLVRTGGSEQLYVRERN